MAGAVEGELVQLYVYDLSGGLARTWSQMLLGKQIEAIFHTSVVVGGLEHFYGGGINVQQAGSTPFGRPVQVLDLGHTQIPEDMRYELLAELSERYTPEAYSLFHNNCNSFSDELAQLLCGQPIPSHITGLPSEVLSTPFGQMIAPMLSGLEQQLRGMRGQALRPAAAAALSAAAEAPPEQAPAAAAAAAGAALGVPAAAAAAAASAPAAAEPAAAEQATEPAAIPHAEAGPHAAAAAHAGEGPALHDATVAIESAVAAGMIAEAEQALHGGQQAQQAGRPAAGRPSAAEPSSPGRQPGSPRGGGAPSPIAEVVTPPADLAAAKLAAELEVTEEFDRLMSGGGLSEHDAQALAFEAMDAHRREEAEAAGRDGDKAQVAGSPHAVWPKTALDGL